MGIPASCLFWHKMESAGAAEKGPAMTWVPTVVAAAAKFNNGIRANLTNDGYGKFVTAALWPTNPDAEQGCVEFWLKFLISSVAWTALNALGGSRFVGGANDCIFQLNLNANETVQLYSGDIAQSIVSAPQVWAANELVHVAIVWDKAGIDGGANTQRIYWNAGLIASGANVLTFDGGWNVNTALLSYGDYENNLCFQALMDNVKIWDYAKTNFSDRFIEGFAISRTKKIRIYAIPEFTPPAPTPVLFAPIKPKVLIIGDVDIYAKGLVDSIGNITEFRSFRKDKLIDNEIQIPVDNKTLYFSPDNPKSPFNGANWYFSQVKVWDQDNIKIWDGLLWDIIRTSQGRTAKLISRSIMSKIKNIKVVYESSDYETGPGALINIFAAVDPPITEYNAKTFQDSINILTAAGAYLKLKITAEDDMPLQSLIEKIAEYCAADAYSHLGEIRFKVWQKITGTGAISIIEKNVLKQPITRSAMGEIINNFSIGYSGDEGTPAIDSANGNIGGVSRSRYGERSMPELSTGDENEIVFKDKSTAVWIGEQYIRRTHRNIDTIPLPLIQSKYSVEGRLRNYIDLETILGFTYSDEGFNEEIMEIFQFVRNNDKNIVDLVAFTRAS